MPDGLDLQLQAGTMCDLVRPAASLRGQLALPTIPETVVVPFLRTCLSQSVVTQTQVRVGQQIFITQPCFCKQVSDWQPRLCVL